jgi:hypothetical protein
MGYMILQFVKDHVSKDLDIPWHQIGPEQVQIWKDKGFELVDFDNWWKEPNKEEKKRMSKMSMGSRVRKDE